MQAFADALARRGWAVGEAVGPGGAQVLGRAGAHTAAAGPAPGGWRVTVCGPGLALEATAGAAAALRLLEDALDQVPVAPGAPPPPGACEGEGEGEDVCCAAGPVVAPAAPAAATAPAVGLADARPALGAAPDAVTGGPWGLGGAGALGGGPALQRGGTQLGPGHPAFRGARRDPPAPDTGLPERAPLPDKYRFL